MLFSLGHNPRLRGHNSRLGGTSSDLGEHGPGMPPRGARSELRVGDRKVANSRFYSPNWLRFFVFLGLFKRILHWGQPALLFVEAQPDEKLSNRIPVAKRVFWSEDSRTPPETQSESTRLNEFLIIAWLQFTKLVHCCILFIEKCLCYVFRKLSNNTHKKLKLENHSSVSILTAFCWCSRLYRSDRMLVRLDWSRVLVLAHKWMIDNLLYTWHWTKSTQAKYVKCSYFRIPNCNNDIKVLLSTVD